MKKSKIEVLNVAFVQVVVPSYKLAMFQAVSNLDESTLTLFSGEKAPAMLAKPGVVIGVKHFLLENKLFKIGALVFLWQKKLNRLLRVKDYDLIILPEGVLYLSNYLIMLRCMIARVPFGFYSHGFNHQRKNSVISRPLEFVRKLIHLLSSVIIVYSEEGARYLVRNGHISTERVFVAPNTLDTKKIMQRISYFSQNDILECRNKLNVKANSILLIYVGRLEPIKNPKWALEVVTRLRSDGVDAHIAFVGDGTMKKSLCDEVSTWSSELSETVTFVGNLPIEEVDIYLASSDISIMPGMSGLSIVHSFAAGKPYVTVESANHSPEINYICNGKNGIIARPLVDEFYKEISLLAHDPLLRKKIGDAGFQTVLNELSMENQIEGFRKAFSYM